MFTHTMHPFGNKFSANNTSVNDSKKSPNLGQYPNIIQNGESSHNHNSRLSTYAYGHSHKKSDHNAQKKPGFPQNDMTQHSSGVSNQQINPNSGALKKIKNSKLSTTPSKSGKISLNRSTLSAFYQLDLKKKKVMEKSKLDKNRGKELRLSDAFFITKYGSKFDISCKKIGEVKW